MAKAKPAKTTPTIREALYWALEGVRWASDDVTPPGVNLTRNFFKTKPVVEDSYAFVTFLSRRIEERFSEAFQELADEKSRYETSIAKISKDLITKRELKVEQEALKSWEEDLSAERREMDEQFATRDAELDKREMKLEEEVVDLEEAVAALDEKVAEGKAKLELNIETRLRKELKQEAAKFAAMETELEQNNAFFNHVSAERDRLITENEAYRTAFVGEFGQLHETMRKAVENPAFVQTIETLAAEVKED